MELWLFRHDEFKQLYNCSYDIGQVPLEARSHLTVGYSLIALTLIFEIAYIPCIWAIYKQMRKLSCYKLMFYIGVCDIICMPIIGLLTGYFAISGAVYCSHPTLMYIVGNIAPELWYAESFAAVLLALNRCLDLNCPKFAERLFGGTRTWKMLTVPTLYAILVGIFFKTPVFNGVLCSWFFNPHIGYLDDPEGKYTSIMHPIHNWSIAISLAAFYGTFSLTLCCKLQNRYLGRSAVFNLTKTQKKLFLQVLLISFIHGFAAVIYDLMQFVHVTPVWTISAQFAWLVAHGMVACDVVIGAPGIIYFSLNESIKKECYRLLHLSRVEDNSHMPSFGSL